MVISANAPNLDWYSSWNNVIIMYLYIKLQWHLMDNGFFRELILFLWNMMLRSIRWQTCISNSNTHYGLRAWYFKDSYFFYQMGYWVQLAWGDKHAPISHIVASGLECSCRTFIWPRSACWIFAKIGWKTLF